MCDRDGVTLAVIGAGFGRTGTLSLKTALERLGFDRCFHMMEVFANPEKAPVFTAASRGEPVDWDAVFDGYRATVDWPACVFWRDLMAAYPDAKVLLSVRPAGSWLKSFKDTIYELMTRLPTLSPDPPAELGAIAEMAGRTVCDRSFGPGFAEMDDEALVDAFERHNQSVRDGVPADRLLEFDVAQGWAPLCRFLGVDVPDEPFPNVNDKAEFRRMFGLDPQPG